MQIAIADTTGSAEKVRLDFCLSSLYSRYIN